MAYKAYKDKVRRIEYLRKWKQNKRQEWKERANSLKTHCKSCYATTDLLFHHRDRVTKQFTIQHGIDSLLSWNRIINEINKCIVLCRACHLDEHRNSLGQMGSS